jgi:hypothetical protein
MYQRGQRTKFHIRKRNQMTEDQREVELKKIHRVHMNHHQMIKKNLKHQRAERKFQLTHQKEEDLYLQKEKRKKKEETVHGEKV